MVDVDRSLREGVNIVCCRHGLIPLIAVLALAAETSALTTSHAESITEPGHDTRFRAAVKLHDSGQYKEAIGAFRDLLAERPDDPTLLCELANSLTASGAPEEAVLQVERVLDRQVEIPVNCSTYLGAALGAMGGYDGPTTLVRDDTRSIGAADAARAGMVFYRVQAAWDDRRPDFLVPQSWTIMVDRSRQKVYRLAGFREDDASELLRDLDSGKQVDSQAAAELALRYLIWTERGVTAPLDSEHAAANRLVHELKQRCAWREVRSDFQRWYTEKAQLALAKAVNESGTTTDEHGYSVIFLFEVSPGWEAVRPTVAIEKWVLSVTRDGIISIEQRTDVVAYPLFGPACTARYDPEKDIPRPRVGDE